MERSRARAVNSSTEECFADRPRSQENCEEDAVPPEEAQEPTPPAHRAGGTGEPEGPVEPDEDYVSPAMSRLEQSGPRRSVIPLIAERPDSAPPASAADERLEALDSRLTTLERHQNELAANLRDAHLAFRRLAQRVDELVERLER